MWGSPNNIVLCFDHTMMYSAGISTGNGSTVFILEVRVPSHSSGYRPRISYYTSLGIINAANPLALA